jgi:hypothetical protein
MSEWSHVALIRSSVGSVCSALGILYRSTGSEMPALPLHFTPFQVHDCQNGDSQNE